MTPHLNSLEREIEREMTLIAKLPAEMPSGAALARVQAAVADEARRGLLRRRWLIAARAVTGAAAAILFVLAMLPAAQDTNLTGDAATADALLSEWGTAYDESALRVADLIEGGWVDERFGEMDDPEAELDALLDSLDASVDDLGAL